MQKSTKFFIAAVVTLLVASLAFAAGNAISVAQTGHPFGMVWSSGNGSMMNGGSGMMGSRDWAELDRVSPVSTNTVILTDQDAFSPMVIQVRAGTNITWTNRDTDNHTVTFMPAMMMNGTVLVPGGSFSYTFSSPGTYNYLCLYHQGMIGRVVVTAS